MFFFFKQKTAYEMRISDWSSDVCSSDLIGASAALAQRGIGGSEIAEPRRFLEADIVGKDDDRIGRRDHIFTQAAEWILVKHRLRGGREPEIALQDKGGAGHRNALATGPAGAATAAGIDIEPVAGLQAGHCGTDNGDLPGRIQAESCGQVGDRKSTRLNSSH